MFDLEFHNTKVLDFRVHKFPGLNPPRNINIIPISRLGFKNTFSKMPQQKILAKRKSDFFRR